MGMFDYLKCDYPLPVDGANARVYQTKDTPAQMLDNYEIRKDGTLWHQKVEYNEDAPEPAKFVCVDGFVGEIVFYDFWREDAMGENVSGWIEWSAYFVDGTVANMVLIENRQQ